MLYASAIYNTSLLLSEIIESCTLYNYISENVKASSVVLVLNSQLFYPLNPFSIGALLGGDLNNSNGGCPSPVREYSYICSDHEFALLLLLLFHRVLLVSGLY